MIGAIAGDIIGSVYEGRKLRSKNFKLFADTCTFTDDTVLTCAVAMSILTGRSYKQCIVETARKYPEAGYGGRFYNWFLQNEQKPYNSYGNGSAMRVSPIGFAFKNENQVLIQAKKSAQISHNHPEGIKGAQAAAMCVFLAWNGCDKNRIKNYVQKKFGYNLKFTLKGLIENYGFDVSCKGSVPQAIFAFLDSTDYEDTIRNCVAIGGDTDTICGIAGAIAEAFYKKIPDNIISMCKKKLDKYLWKIIKKFSKKVMGVKLK